MAGLNILPNSGQSLGQTRDDIKNNFTYINTGFLADHVELNSGGNSGKHKAVHFINQTNAPTAPTTAAGECAIYAAPSLVNPLISALFLKRESSLAATNGIEITYALTNPAGWTQLPSGIMLQWGTSSINNQQLVTFPRAIPTACLIVFLTEVVADGSSETNFLQVVDNIPFTTTQFTARAKTRTGGVATTARCVFLAIGY
jgi:hypothetical protein